VKPIRVLFAGTPEVALPALDLLVADDRFRVVAVLTNPDRPRGRSATPQPSAVASRAAELALPLLQPQRVRDAVGAIRDSGADVGAIVAYGSILPPAVLDALPLGFVNLHFSLLPRWRGAAPVQHAIRAGDAVTGVTAFRLDAGMDTGPVLRSLERRISDLIDAGALLAQLAVEGAPVLIEALLAVANGEPGTPQPVDGATLAPRIGAADAVVDWRRPACEVAAHVRSVTPRPGASTTLAGEPLKIAGALLVRPSPDVLPDDLADDIQPGTVVHTDGEGIVVRCGDGLVHIARLQLPGRAWTAAADLVRGRGLAVGMVLGTVTPST
jgi:methionyl-tRNA formyltransferase